MSASPETQQGARTEGQARRENRPQQNQHAETAASAQQARAAREVRNFQENRERIDANEKREIRARVTRDLKEDIAQNTRAAQETSKEIDMAGGRVPGDRRFEAAQLQSITRLFTEAAREGLIHRPDHPPTAVFFDKLVNRLATQGTTPPDAAYFHPLINGILNANNYVQFSQEGDPPTRFEQDLQHVVSTAGGSQAEDMVTSIILEMLGENHNLGITAEQFEQKRRAAKEQRAEVMHELKEEQRQLQIELGMEDQYSRQEDSHIINLLRGDTEQADAGRAEKLYMSLDDPRKFYDFYTEQLKAKRREAGLPEDAPAPNNQDERFAKEITKDIQRLLLYITHKIYAPVITGNTDKPFAQLVADAAGVMGRSPNTTYNRFRDKITRLQQNVQLDSPHFDDVPFYQYKREQRRIWMEEEKGQEGSKDIRGKMVVDTVATNQLSKATYKDFLENLHTSLDAERGLLEVGINFNYLMLTGKTQEGASFFRQAQQYAEQNLSGDRIDELYKLPYAEIVEAAKIQLSNYYREKLSENRWVKDPQLLQGIFENINQVEKAAIEDMIRSHRQFNNAPEWAVRRAILHARMHLSLIDLELHALSSYGHAPVKNWGDASYRDPALKNLETFDTWWNAEMWQVSDTYVKGMAFMPLANRNWKIPDWYHKNVTTEGQEVFHQAFEIGALSRVGRKYFTFDTPPNIMEKNPIGWGGIEHVGGWRTRYPMISWIEHMTDQLGADEETIVLDAEGKNLTRGWKQLENIGINMLKEYRDSFLFNDDYIDPSNENAMKNYKTFFSFLYERYFKDGVGKDGFKISFKDNQYKDVTYKYNQIQTPEQFWDCIVKPILERPGKRGEGELEGQWKKRTKNEKKADLQKIVNHALATLAFERGPMSMVTMENPTRSQNGMTLRDYLQTKFIGDQLRREQRQGRFTDPKSAEAIQRNAELATELKEAFHNLTFVEQKARMESIHQMQQFVDQQADNPETVRSTTFAASYEEMDQNERSQIELVAGQEEKGYVVNEQVIKAFLEERYGLAGERQDRNMSDQDRQKYQAKVEKALEVYREIRGKIVLKPDKNPKADGIENKDIDKIKVTKAHIRIKMREMGYNPDINPEDDSEAIAEFKKKHPEVEDQIRQKIKKDYDEAYEKDITSRINWAGQELGIYGKKDVVPISMNDTAYQFLEFVRAGRGVVSRTLGGMASTQEAYKQFVNGGTGDGSLLSALKKYYRKEDLEELHKGIVAMRNAIKDEDTDAGNEMAMRVLENSMNVMRINTDAENMLIEAQYMLRHQDRAAFATVVNEGPQYPLHREDRYRIVSEFLHSAQFPKHTPLKEQVYEEVQETFREKWQDFGWIGKAAGSVADMFLGPEEGKLVRQQWKEMSGNGLRDREIANVVHIIMREGPKYMALLMLAVLILTVRKAYEENEE